MSDKIPVLFDTDIGSDIDDVLALSYLLKQPRCELLGVTTVTGQPLVRAQLVDAVCQALGRTEVPVYAGAGKPMLVRQRQPEVPQKVVLEKWPHREKFGPNMAVDFLRQTIRSRPGEITLLSVGPLTNVGLLFALDPEIPTLLKQWVLMGGLFIERGGLLEWNIIGDPHASAIAFAARAPGTRAYGLDVTTKCTMPVGECREHFSKGPLRIVSEMAAAWAGGGNPRVTFHDPLAAACVFESDICKCEAGLVEVEMQSERLRGLTYFSREAKERPHQVAVGVRPDAFFKHYFDIVRPG